MLPFPDLRENTRRVDIRLKPGERGLLVGQTGSGKTYAAAWLLRHSEQRCIILDTKTEPVFTKLPEGKPDDPMSETLAVVHSIADMLREYRDVKRGADYVVVRPSNEEVAKPALLDAYLSAIYETCRDVMVLIDEAYQFHTGATAGPGLVGLLTRGRARALTTLVATQRPAWLSRFALTESQRMYIFRLTDRKDWARLAEMVPGIPKEGVKLPPYGYLYYVQGDDAYRRMAPLPPIASLSYTPQVIDSEQKKGQRRKWF